MKCFRFVIAASMGIIAAFGCCTPLAEDDRAVAITGNQNVDRLLGQMTLDEKIALIHGEAEPAATNQGQAGYLPGIPRLGIPSLRLADGPPGVLTRHPSTGMTATMGLAATFSAKDAQANGVVIGRDARSLGIDIVLEPFINLDRDITGARTYNTYGEDPVLTGRIGAAVIRGIQSQGTMAQAKHYVGYDGADRSTELVVDAQTLHEVYIAPFANAVEAGVSSIMCAYSRLNGAFACGNSDTQVRILKDELNFQGFVTSDWGATHGTANFINNGLDLEMPGTFAGVMGIVSYFNRDAPPESAYAGFVPAGAFASKGGTPEETDSLGASANTAKPFKTSVPTDPRSRGLLAAIRDGEVKEETVTRAAGRILLQMDKFGLLDRKPKHDATPIDSQANAEIVRKTAEDAAVLLKNEGGALPLRPSDLQSLAMIGAGAGQTIAFGDPGEKALGFPARQIGAVQAMQNYLAKGGTVHITYAPATDMTGRPVPASAFSHGAQPGLLRTDPATGRTQVDAQLNFARSNGNALPSGSAQEWTGSLDVPIAGSYMINLQVLGATASLRLDGNEIATTGNPQGILHGNTLQAGEHNILPTTDGLDNVRRKVELTAGAHALSVSAAADISGEPVQVRLSWVTPEQQKADYAAAIAAARQAKTAVVFAWARGIPAFQLPGDQNRLIEDIAAVNPNTIVVLNMSQPAALPWLGKVKAVLLMWYPGDEGGWATANILLGKASPAGRLPFTWPRSLDQTLTRDPAHPERSGHGADGKTVYSEGVDIGYRWYDRAKIEPLFPFGYGLTYSPFEYSGLVVKGASDGGVDLSFRLKNAGKQMSDEVPQLYLGAPRKAPDGAQFAVRALAGFDRIAVQPGETSTVTLHVARRSLEYWSISAGRWMTATGPRTVYVGASSRDLRLQTDAVIAP